MKTELLSGRIADTANICERTQRPKFLGFLSKEESVLVERLLKNRNVNFTLFGGYPDAERVMLGCFPDWDEECLFPIAAVTFTYRSADLLTHRDFLGSLMALGLTRESVGDILVEEGRAVAFVTEEVGSYIINEISKIGKTGVTAKSGFDSPLPPKAKLSEFASTVASERLDCVVAAICNISRGGALQKINDGLVSVNSAVIEKSTKTVADGDVISVKGKGKFIIESVTDRTRKSRIVLKYKKYV